jgi:hypothetical protein
MSELAPGARQLPLHHVSIRVPWHDRGWDGSICADPKANSSCLILPRVADLKDDDAEEVYRAQFWKDIPETQWPGCQAERAACLNLILMKRPRPRSMRTWASKPNGFKSRKTNWSCWTRFSVLSNGTTRSV